MWGGFNLVSPVAFQCRAVSTSFFPVVFQCTLQVFDGSPSGNPVYTGSTSGIPVYTGPTRVHWLKEREASLITLTFDKSKFKSLSKKYLTVSKTHHWHWGTYSKVHVCQISRLILWKSPQECQNVTIEFCFIMWIFYEQRYTVIIELVWTFYLKSVPA